MKVWTNLPYSFLQRMEHLIKQEPSIQGSHQGNLNWLCLSVSALLGNRVNMLINYSVDFELCGTSVIFADTSPHFRLHKKTGYYLRKMRKFDLRYLLGYVSVIFSPPSYRL